MNESAASIQSLAKIRKRLLFTGCLLALSGLICMVAPIWFTAPIEWLIGGLLCLNGSIGAINLTLGHVASLGDWGRLHLFRIPAASRNSSSSAMVKERATVWVLVVLQLLLGFAIIVFRDRVSLFFFVLLLIAVAAEGCIVFLASMQFESLATKMWMWNASFISLIVVAVTFYYWESPNAHRLLGMLIGIKLLLLCVVFIRISLTASDSDLRSAYIGLSSFINEPTTGSIYAVYYGPAFHCGIYVGEGLVVDYLTDGIVRCVSWEEFLLGRQAMEWNYPDVVSGDAHAISAFARSFVGKYTRYDALKFNCENLAIFCRSEGNTTYSRFSQSAIGIEFVRQKPILGSLLQVLNRGVSWFLYGAGGPFGKQVGFALIRIARAATDWFVARPLRMSDELRMPVNDYVPEFSEASLVETSRDARSDA